MRKIHITLGVLLLLGVSPPVLGAEELSLGELRDLCLNCGKGKKEEGEMDMESGALPTSGGKALRLNLGMSPEEIRALENPDQPILPRRVVR